jgi:hypothetical protein
MPSWYALRLRVALPLIAEERFRDDGTSYLRPQSMMLCPPNNYMSGFTTFSNVDWIAHSGLKELRCTTVTDSPETITVRLSAGRTVNPPDAVGETGYLAPNEFNGHSFSGPDAPSMTNTVFSIDQNIGNPDQDLGLDALSHFNCPQIDGRPGIVRGISYDDTATDKLSGLAIACIDAAVVPVVP